MKKLFLFYVIKHNILFSIIAFSALLIALFIFGLGIFSMIYSGITLSLSLALLQLATVPIVLLFFVRERIRLFLSRRYSRLILTFKFNHLFWYYYEINLTYEQLHNIESIISENNYDIIIDKSVLFSKIYKVPHIYDNIKNMDIQNIGFLVRDPADLLSVRLSV